MPPTRAEVALQIASLVGDDFVIDEVADGWPSLARVHTPEAEVPVALFAAPVGLSHRDRDHIERRFQNPAASAQQKGAMGWQGRPLSVPEGRVPLLAGVWTEDELVQVADPVLVLADAWKREGLTTRHSVFVRIDALIASSVSGWSESVSFDGEVMPCFRPALLPALVDAAAGGIDLPFNQVALAVEAAGMSAQGPGDGPIERARRSVNSIVRDARFSRNVIDAYDGLCAMCGLDLGLVQGAHIYPASAPASPDVTSNGLCLCSNHHLAFDRHFIWVDPQSRSVTLSPEILSQVDANEAASAFAESTFSDLAEPVTVGARPAAEMFEARYAYFEAQYDWV